MIDASGGKLVALEVTGPLGEVAAFYGLMGDGQTAGD
jgi:glycerate kinase